MRFHEKVKNAYESLTHSRYVQRCVCFPPKYPVACSDLNQEKNNMIIKIQPKQQMNEGPAVWMSTIHLNHAPTTMMCT